MISWVSEDALEIRSGVVMNSVADSFIASEFYIFDVVHVCQGAWCALSAHAPAFFKDEVVYLQVHQGFMH